MFGKHYPCEPQGWWKWENHLLLPKQANQHHLFWFQRKDTGREMGDTHNPSAGREAAWTLFTGNFRAEHFITHVSRARARTEGKC
jgi:hypothetical protein